MMSLRTSAPLLFSLWVAACATAEDGPLPGGSAGDSSTSAGAGASAPGAGAGGKVGGSAGAGTAGSGVGAHAGAAGRAGAGAGGSSGSGGGGGAPPVFEPGACAETPTMSLKYQNDSSQPEQIAAEYQFSNTSDTPVALGSLVIRYFFSSEETSGWNASVFNAEIKGPGDAYQKANATLKVVPLGSKVDGADTYAELAFTAGPMLAKGATASAKWGLQPSNYGQPNQVQTNDYSYNAATAFTVWDHVAIYQGTTLVWGCLPKAADGSAGAAGAGGVAGTGGTAGSSGGASGAAGSAGGSGGAVSTGVAGGAGVTSGAGSN